jgi:hypothetical protein
MRTNSCDQFRKRKGLKKVVIRSSIETFDAISDRVPGSHYDYGEPDPFAARDSEDLDTAFAWEHPIQKHQVKGLGVEQEKGFLASFGPSDLVLLRFQTFLDGFG